ncbi:hypothetical protein BIW11_07058 [Tropilaelaps mercedesae]|uniref:BTB domain-containing protein n=1 Tax=Tropilaelaps mercedesae TaxID=418985 RepID=A0A1V9XVG4_9ACAR|nr:hypothetical protein BIW11_07058 [Tropilaelaps mercedesae]
MREPEGRLLEMSWDGFDESMRKELDWFWRDQRTLTDVTLFCDGGSVRAHKLVLALCSPYFLNMCIETQTGCNNSVISLRGVDVADFKLLLEFMYRGHVLVEESKVEHVVKLARALYVRGFGSERELRKKRERNGSVGSVFADSDGEENDENNQRRKVYIRPEEIALDDVPPNRVTRASLASQEVARSSRRLSESRGRSPEKKDLPVKEKTCPKRPPLIAAKSPEKSGNTSQDKKSPKPSPRKLREKIPAAENEAPKDVGGKKDPPKHICKLCDFTATTATMLATHLVQKHHPMSPKAAETPAHDKRSPEKPKESPKEEVSSLICDICGFTAGNAGALGNHRNRHKQPEIVLPKLVTPVTSATLFVPPVMSPSPPKSLPVTDVHLQMANSEHFKLIYDCPKCIKISFKTPNIMTRHLMKRHHGEAVQPITRVNCGHCEHAFLPGARLETFVVHLKQAHGIDAHEVKEVIPVQIKNEPIEDDADQSAVRLESGACVPVGARGIVLNGPVDGHANQSSGQHATGEPLVDTASNADTERAPSSGSFVLSPTPSAGDRATVVLSKRSRLSHDDEATIETSEVPSGQTTPAITLTTPSATDLSRIKREADASSDLVGEENGVFHKCPQCNYHTSQEHFLKRHMIACHSNGSTEEPFLCKYCNFSTGHRSTIKSHLVMVHRDTTTKVKDCFRNAAEINRLEQTAREETKKRLHRNSERAMADGSTGNTTDGKVTRKRKTFPGSRSSTSVPMSGASEGALSTPTTRAKRSRKSRSEEETKSPGKLKSPSPKTPRSLQKLEAALKLKKAALAKQRRRSESAQTGGNSGTPGKESKGSRSSSRLSTVEHSVSEDPQVTMPPKKTVSTGSTRVPTGAVTSSSGRDLQSGSVELKDNSNNEAVKDSTCTPKEKESKELKCPDCTYVAKSQVMFEKHVSLHSSCDETKLALCELCGVVKLKVSMGYHMKRHEPRDSGASSATGKST